MPASDPQPRPLGAWLLAILVLAAACSVTAQDCRSRVATWSNCGGSYLCPCGTAAPDGQWPGTCCQYGDQCVRKDRTWWRCEPRSPQCTNSVGDWSTCGDANGPWGNSCCRDGSACRKMSSTWWRCEPGNNIYWNGGACFKHVPTWNSCGGATSCPASTSNCDAPWPQTCCAQSTDTCVRQSSNWWRCQPQEDNSQRSCWTYHATYEACGGWNNRPAGVNYGDQQWPNHCCVSPADVCTRHDQNWWRCQPSNHAPSVRLGASVPRGNPPPPLRVSGIQVQKANTGQQVFINGINWFGYNVARMMVDGLNTGGSAMATDFATIAYQLRHLGFNTVRIPFRWRDLDSAPTDYTTRCRAASADDIKKRTLEPWRWTNNGMPGNPAPLPNAVPGYCNTHLSTTTSTYDRLLWTIQVFVSQNMYVILDYQPMGTENQALTVAEFRCKWSFLWQKVAALPNWASDIRGRVLVDVMNEPDSMGIRWEAANGKPGAADLYLAVMDDLWALTPNGVIFMNEGAGQVNYGLNWGNGFITDANIIKWWKLSDASPYFDRLLSKPYVGSVILTPHVYPPSITKSVFLGNTLWECRVAFGYLQTTGYCKNGSCRKFPVVVGETGSYMTDSTDNQWLNDFADFIQARGGARSYNWAPLGGWLWWTYNENSHDTGGIVYNNWQDLNWQKLKFMVYELGLNPWWNWPGYSK